MNKMIKYVTLPALALVLAACQNTTPDAPAESSAESSVVESSSTSTEQVSVSGESQSEVSTESAEATSNDESATAEAPADEASETAVTFGFYVSGQEAPVAEFTLEDAEGKSVLEAMQSNAELEFNFNETDGVIDTIAGYENDYEAGTTWTYILNGEYAQLGVVSQTLTAGDKVEWYYGTIDEIPTNIVIEE